MGEWMMLPEAEDVIAERINRFQLPHRKGNWVLRTTGVDRISGLASNIDYNDIANMADVAETPLWECELPS